MNVLLHIFMSYNEYDISQSKDYGSPSGSYESGSRDYESPGGGYGSPNKDYRSPSVGYGSPNKDYGSPSGGYESQNRDYGSPSVGYGSQNKDYASPSANYGSSSKQYRSESGTAYDSYANDDHTSSKNSGYSSHNDPPKKRRRQRSRQYGVRATSSLDGGYSSFRPSYDMKESYNPAKGSPREEYNPAAWAQWMTEGEGGRGGRRGRGYRHRKGPDMTPLGPSGGGEDDSTTTVTASHIIHHYKPEEADQGIEDMDTSVIGAIKKHLPPLPQLPWPFNAARRMGTENGEEIFIEDMKEEDKPRYPDSIQSILENLETQGTNLVSTQRFPFLEEEEKFLGSLDRKELYDFYREEALYNDFV